MPSALKLTYQSRSEYSSSDDNMMISHDVASGLQMVHNKAIVHPSELIAEEDAIELSTMPVTGHRLVEYEDSLQTTSTFSPKTVSLSDRETLETTLSASTTIDTFDRESHSRSMRSRSYLSNSHVWLQIAHSMLSELDVLIFLFQIFCFSPPSTFCCIIKIKCCVEKLYSVKSDRNRMKALQLSCLAGIDGRIFHNFFLFLYFFPIVNCIIRALRHFRSLLSC